MRDSFPLLRPTVSNNEDPDTPRLDWNVILVDALPKRMLLGSLLLAVGIGVDLPWLDGNAIQIILLRLGLVGGVALCALLGKLYRSQPLAEILVVAGSLAGITGMATIAVIEGTYIAYTVPFTRRLSSSSSFFQYALHSTRD